MASLHLAPFSSICTVVPKCLVEKGIGPAADIAGGNVPTKLNFTYSPFSLFENFIKCKSKGISEFRKGAGPHFESAEQ
jgi:hypothetical protein